MDKLLEFLGFYRCNLCGKREFFTKGKIFDFTDDGEINYKAYCCRNCMKEIKED